MADITELEISKSKLDDLTKGNQIAFRQSIESAVKSFISGAENQIISTSLNGKLGVELKTANSFFDTVPFEHRLGIKISDQHRIRETSDYNILNYGDLLLSGIDFLTRAITLKEDAQELLLRSLNDLFERERYQNEHKIEAAALEKGTSLDTAGSIYKKVWQLENHKSSLDDLLSSLPIGDTQTSYGLQRSLLKIEIDKIETDIKIAKAAIATRIKNLEAEIAWNQKLFKRLILPGGAANVSERITALRHSFDDNISEGFWRLRAANEGISIIFPDRVPKTPGNVFKFEPFPQVSSDGKKDIGYSDELLAWARSTLFTLERIRKFHTNHVYMVSLRTVMQNAHALKSGIKSDIWPNIAKTLQGGTPLQFTLNGNIYPGLGKPRLQGLKILVITNSFTRTNFATWNNQHTSYRGNLVPPPQIKPDGKPIDVKPISFGKTRQLDSGMPEMISPSYLKNISPLGQWSIDLDPASHSVPGTAANKIIEDIWLELTIDGIPQNLIS